MLDACLRSLKDIRHVLLQYVSDSQSIWLWHMTNADYGFGAPSWGQHHCSVLSQGVSPHWRAVPDTVCFQQYVRRVLQDPLFVKSDNRWDPRNALDVLNLQTRA